MDFSLSMEHEILRKSVRDFAEKEIKPVARELDEKEEFSYKTMKALAKLYCSEVMGRCVDHAVQLHGGYGLMKEYDVERFYRYHKLLEIGEGTSEVQRIVISRYIDAV